jgi:hypothetical protein
MMFESSSVLCRERMGWPSEMERALESMRVDMDAQRERTLGVCLTLTDRGRWGHLYAIESPIDVGVAQDYDLNRDNGVLVWSAQDWSMSCTWPDSVVGSRLGVMARLSVGEG